MPKAGFTKYIKDYNKRYIRLKSKISMEEVDLEERLKCEKVGRWGVNCLWASILPGLPTTIFVNSYLSQIKQLKDAQLFCEILGLSVITGLVVGSIYHKIRYHGEKGKKLLYENI